MKLLITRAEPSVYMILADTDTVVLDTSGVTINGIANSTVNENSYELIEDVTAEAFLIDIEMSKYSWHRMSN